MQTGFFDGEFDRDVRPIVTHWAGCRFRSKTEAHWAVFFEYIGLDWEWEYQGFEMPNLPRYLPDFYFERSRNVVEIKGTDQHREPAIEKCKIIAKHLYETAPEKRKHVCHLPYGSGSCYLMEGRPGAPNFAMFSVTYWRHDDGKENWFVDQGLLAQHQLNFSDYVETPKSLVFCTRRNFGEIDGPRYSYDAHPIFCADYSYVKKAHPLKDALLIARQARFDRGQEPKLNRVEIKESAGCQLIPWPDRFGWTANLSNPPGSCGY